ncbi:Uma2 family endonuclease [Leptothermofonsia sichuanensis E412]|uniref:Uma2 family endonuclease n=1 Tax=Leptothermofonsia sichuanensis TaxID=2917832 RepID=UPI001CA793E3|nr:Uma2 family endonuclease [Leptothermofonsia sichuanensis]QZZ20309.1 Uma2 family endonuclease [Leptothermofonsia sichuanensis E412]
MSETTLPPTLTTLPPTQAELPCDDGVPMETARHKAQMDLLIDGLIPWLSEREDGFVGGNMFVYYSLAQIRNQDFKGPDFFVVLGVPKGERKSWVVWEEGKAPDVVIELLSESTATVDKTEKKLIYQNQMRVPEYFWYDPFNPEDWAGFSIQQRVYQPLLPNERNQLLSESLGLALQRWQGNYKGIEATWLRWATPTGELLPTPEEQERQRAEQERQRADRAEEQLLQTARNLLLAGMDVEQVVRVTGLDASAIAPWVPQSDE